MEVIHNDALQHFVSDANKVVCFKLVRSVDDLSDLDLSHSTGKDETNGHGEPSNEFLFNPEFSHQVFGQQESIFGYRNLRINLYYTASKLNRLLSVKYSERIDPDNSGGVPPDDIFTILRESLGVSFVTSIDHFSQLVTEDGDFLPYGTHLETFTIQDKINQPAECTKERTFTVFRTDMETANFKQYHESMQTFLTWFIDAASNIDTDDHRWDYFVMYEKCQNNDGKTCYYFVGYATIYQYYAYPDKIRPRISQFLILPPFQRKGLGAHLLESIYNCYVNNSRIVDITVEDPSEEFAFLRDYVDCKRCMSLQNFNTDELKKGWNIEMAKEAQDKYKISRRQARKIYEILKLKCTNPNDEPSLRNYRLEVKNRLNAPYHKIKRSALSDEELGQVLTNKETRIQELNLLYSQIHENYTQTIAKLESC